MDVAVEQVSLEEGTTAATDLRLDVARAQVLHEEPFEPDAAVLEPPRQHDERDGRQGDGYDKGVLEAGEVVADVEDEARRNDHPDEDGEDERQAVETVLGPECLELLAVVLLHYHGAQEGRDEGYGEHARDAVGPPVQLPSGQ